MQLNKVAHHEMSLRLQVRAVSCGVQEATRCQLGGAWGCELIWQDVSLQIGASAQPKERQSVIFPRTRGFASRVCVLIERT